MKEGNHGKTPNELDIIPYEHFRLHNVPLGCLGIVIEDGYDMRTVRELLGHNDIRTTYADQSNY